MPNTPIFYRKDGTLTTYGLACGYVESKTVSRVRPGDVLPCALSVRLYREHNCYHVRVFNQTQSHPESWETFDTVTEARKAYRAK